MRVFVTGGTGAIGRFVIPALVGAGHEVTALARDDAKAARLEREGAHVARVSLFDRDALTKAFAGHDAVANLATAIPPTKEAFKPTAWATNTRIRTEGSAAPPAGTSARWLAVAAHTSRPSTSPTPRPRSWLHSMPRRVSTTSSTTSP